MNPLRRSLTLAALGMTLLLGLTVGWLPAITCLLAFEFSLALPSARLGTNTLGTLATATIVQEALALVFTKRPILNSISMGFTDSNGSPIAAYNQSVITRIHSIPTVNNFGSSASNRADTDVSVTLDNFKEVFYSYTVTEYSSTDRNLVREAAEPLAVAVANHMVDAIAATWTTTNFPTRTGADAVANGSTATTTTLANGWDYDHLLDVRKTLNKSGVPDSSRFYVGNSDVYGALLSDLRIVAALNNTANGGAITSGKLPVVANFGLDEYPGLPTTGNMVAFSGTKDSTVYAHRVPRDPRELLPSASFPGNLGIVTEPRTGLSVMVMEWIGTDLTVNTKLIWMYGTDVGNPNNGQLVISA
jgi:hypothetical protein